MVGVLLGAIIVIILLVLSRFTAHIVSPLGQFLEKPLDKYTIDALHKRQYSGSPIILNSSVATTSGFTVYPFYFTSDGKKVTGLAYVPNARRQKDGFPVIAQFRGFVEHEKYSSGEGTRHSSEVFANNGFLTLAPDFLGYGESASPSADVFEERFQTYTTAINLLASISTLPMADTSKVGIWGHSNGGQIALTVLEITGTPYPTTLWAPVSKPFPYSILYYTDDFDDHGKALRKALAKFEDNYDVELYSLTNYVDRIAGPIQIHQGTADESVPEKWSFVLTKTLKKKERNVAYFTYPGADHNLMLGWDMVVSRDVAFFNKYLK